MERKYVVFKIANEEFGIDITRIQEVADFEAITRVPDSLDYVEGIINMRGEIIPIINLRRRLNLSSDLEEVNEKIIITTIRNDVYGFLVDMTSEIINIDDNDIHLPSILETDFDSSFLKGVAKYSEKLVIMLDFDVVIN